MGTVISLPQNILKDIDALDVQRTKLLSEQPIKKQIELELTSRFIQQAHQNIKDGIRVDVVNILSSVVGIELENFGFENSFYPFPIRKFINEVNKLISNQDPVSSYILGKTDFESVFYDVIATDLKDNFSELIKDLFFQMTSTALLTFIEDSYNE